LLLLVLLTLLFVGMYMFLPGRRNKFGECLPGAIFAALSWQVLSLLFSVYVENFTAYANIYGSVSSVALGLLWLYLCLCILFFGAALNRWLKE
jgi:membrane protein